MGEKTNIKDFSIDPEQAQEILKKISNIAESLVKVILDTFRDFWDKMNGNMILQYKKLYNQSQWKYIKKGKRYVKVRRNNCEDIGRAFLRKIQHSERLNDEIKTTQKVDICPNCESNDIEKQMTIDELLELEEENNE